MVIDGGDVFPNTQADRQPVICARSNIAAREYPGFGDALGQSVDRWDLEIIKEI
jgi:hypothetical protein